MLGGFSIITYNSRMKAPKPQYIPGVCNIGPAEIRARQLVGWVGLATTIAVWGLLHYVQTPALTRLIVGLPAGAAASGFIQGAMHFCAGFGMQGLFNMGNTVGATENAFQSEMRQADQRKAWQIIRLSALVGASVALLAIVF